MAVLNVPANRARAYEALLRKMRELQDAADVVESREVYFAISHLAEALARVRAPQDGWRCGAIIDGTVPDVCDAVNPANRKRCFACGAERPVAKAEHAAR